MILFSKPCDECGGTGWEPLPPFDAAIERTSYPCPSCFGGMVPDDATVEAAAKGIWNADPRNSRWDDEPDDVKFEALEWTLAGLVAAARYQSEEKP